MITPRRGLKPGQHSKAEAEERSQAQAAGQVIEEVDESGTSIESFLVSYSGSEVERSGPTIALRSAENISIRERGRRLWAEALAVFLPAGYPHSVTEDYLEYQIYDSLQAFCSSIAGLLSSRAVLEGVGVGDANANATTALLLSAVQESVGRIATILFAHRLGTSLEPECKCYRLAADVFNDAAMVLDCLSPAFPKPIRVGILSGSSVLRALCGVAAGSAKASLSAHFAKKGNLGEVNAKDSSQETVISLIGMLAGTVVVSTITTPFSTWLCMLSLLTLHLYLNYRAVRAVRMPTLNRQRANIVLSSLFQQISDSDNPIPTSPPNDPSDPTSPSSPSPNRSPFSPVHSFRSPISPSHSRHSSRAQRLKRLIACPPTLASHHESIFSLSGALRLYTLDGPSSPSTSSQFVKYGTATFSEPFSKLVSAVQRAGCSMSDLIGAFGGQHFVLWFDVGASHALICVKDTAGPRDLVKAWAVAMMLGVLAREAEEERREGHGEKNEASEAGAGGSIKGVDAFMMHVDALSRVHEDWGRMVKGLEGSGWDLGVGCLETGKARRLRFRKED